MIIISKTVAGIDGRSARDRRIVLRTYATAYLILLCVQVALESSVSPRTFAFVAFRLPCCWPG